MHRQRQRANEVVVVTAKSIHHCEFGRENGELFLRPVRMIQIPSENLSNVYSCELAPKTIFVSNLPQCYDDFARDRKIYVYNADVQH